MRGIGGVTAGCFEFRQKEKERKKEKKIEAKSKQLEKKMDLSSGDYTQLLTGAMHWEKKV